MVLPKILYRIYFSYEHSYAENLNHFYFGELCESIDSALQSVFSRMDNLDKEEATKRFPQEVDIEFYKAVMIDNEEYRTSIRKYNLVDKNELFEKLKKFLEGKN